MNLLIIEDDRDIAELIAYNCAQEKMATETCHSGAEGLVKARRMVPSVIILDLMLPDIGGLEVCRALKADAKTAMVPIVMLTAKGSEVDRVVGFEVGADDYVTKPFSPRELILRIKAIMRRRTEGETHDAECLQTFGILEVDPARVLVRVRGKTARLTAIEFKLLHYLLTHQGRVTTRDRLLDHVWGYDAALNTRTVDVHINRLREKLGKAGEYIETVRGMGYRFVEEITKRS
ncbi:MAG: response regulator transcription factor [Deltaproteobacteria bacterium]|nr:response regulator transcription factor [Deltaproteobacteria bacterium]